MGKAALILVAAVTVASGSAYLSQDRAAFDGVQQEALYEHQVLAREIAQSGFNRIESRVRRDFNSHRANQAGIAHAKGRLDITATGDSGGPVSISATGHYEDAEYTITGTLSKSGLRVLDALTIDGTVGSANFGGNAVVSGIDTNRDGTSGANVDVHAVLTDENATYLALLTELVAGAAPGVAGLLDIVDDTPEISLATLASDINAFSGPQRSDVSGNTTLEDEALGTADNPIVLVSDGDLTLSGSTAGYGVLYVDGTLSMTGSSSWEGLVMVDNDGGTHSMTGTASVYGAVIIRSVMGSGGDGGDGGLPGGHFDVDVFDEFGAGDYRYHQHKYDDEFDVTGIDLLDPDGCGSGGLCWESILGDEDAVYVEFVNADMGYGTYEIEAGAGSVDETCDSGGGGGWSSDDDDDGGSGGDDDDDGGWGDDDDDDGGWWDDDDDLLAGGMPADVRAAGFGDMSWLAALSNRLLTLFQMDAGKSYICHKPGKLDLTLHVNDNALPAHFAHGDTLGPCGSSDDDDDGGSDDDDDGGSDDDDDDGGDSDDDDDDGGSDDDDDDGGSWWDDDDDGGSDDDDDGGSSDDDDDGGSGGDDCSSGSVGIPSVSLAGNTHEGLAPTLMDARQAMTFQVNFEYLCALQISSPNGVIYDPTNRNDAFTVRIKRAEHNGSSWSEGDVIYETSVYHHTGYGWDYNPGGEICDPSNAEDGTLAGEPIDLQMTGSPRIQYSSSALHRVRDLLSQVNPGEGSIRLEGIREAGLRPTLSN